MTAQAALTTSPSRWCALRQLVRHYRPDDLSRLDKLGWRDADLDATANELWGTVGQPRPVTLAMALGFGAARLGIDWRERQLDRLAELYGPHAFGAYYGREPAEHTSRSVPQ